MTHVRMQYRFAHRYMGYIVFVLLLCVTTVLPQQLSVTRIDQMPNVPVPYQMRNWKKVAQGYDSLVFNFNLTGTYLPLVWINSNTVNYPSQNSFGLNTVVGTTAPTSAEAINCLPAVIGASLSGVDKTSQNGRDFVLMSEEWFNKRPEQNVYKNHPVDDTGDDWWYETMPNVFFYQLNYLYPGTGDFNNQFTTVADRWLLATQTMGGSATPWQIPNMDHRGWYLQTMTPYDNSVHEPEAAGAIGWILYNAWVKTHNPKYRIGAEWAMEFLNGLSSNPSYELQLSYGTYLAARMNAELGATYDIAKMVNWCFDVGPLRSWGAMVGNWGGYDCSGLIGEVNGINNYAFAMNTFEQIGELVPMVRYDDRFARAIGKWVLNAANASRLFYPDFLPSANQDSYAWALQYDSMSVIGHEAMRQFNGGTSPYATGDAISGGWGLTTLALYGSSHVGILGGIIDTTNVPMILKLDVLKTDYYHDTAYQTFLYFNPYDSTVNVAVDVGNGQNDLYDAVSNQFLQNGVSGVTNFFIPGNTAVLLVIIPSGGHITYQLNKMLVNGIVVDYNSGQTVGNYPPRIKSLSSVRSTILRGDSVNIYCTATDDNQDSLSYLWRTGAGTRVGSGPTIRWVAPNSIGNDSITCIVNDGKGGSDTATVIINVVAVLIQPPVILKFSAQPRKIDLNAVSQLTCTVADSNVGTLSYVWGANQGSISGTGSSVKWTAPDTAGNYMIYCSVTDSLGNNVRDSIGIEVRDFSQVQTGQLVAYYAFNGNAIDGSGNNNNGVVHSATLVSDRNGNPGSAYSFNGTTSYIDIPNSSGLNFQQSISTNFWINIGAFFTREQYPLSHGNYQNRWKISISNNHIRWTVKTATGIKDLDSETEPLLNTWYNVTTVYNGSDYELYINGNLDAFSSWSGLISTTTIDLVFGQDLPTDQQYNFQGMLDEVRIYNYGLSMQEIQQLAGNITAVEEQKHDLIPKDFTLDQNYPNPFNPTTTIIFGLPKRSYITVKVFDILGQPIATLYHGYAEAGFKSVMWNATDVPSGIYFYQLISPYQQFTRKLVLLR